MGSYESEWRIIAIIQMLSVVKMGGVNANIY